jgi:hypothetical protein
MPSLSFKIPTEEMKAEINDALNDVADHQHLIIQTKADALLYIARQYVSKYTSLGSEQIPHSILETIRLADCEFIRHNTLKGFQCYEYYFKDKKVKDIATEHERVIESCVLCKKGKAKSILNDIESQFRKKGVTSFVKLINDLIRIDHEGAIAQIFMCQGKRFSEDELILSPDCTHIKCPELEDELIVIEEYCLTQIDPHTMKPPCRYLVAPFLKVDLKIPREAQRVMDELKQLENQEIPDEPKEVDAEYEVKEEN